ncbi:MAG: bacillithiol biosynthesis BshC, partial [Chitinophagaceae bacterium]|nr:bacillithiol biosynthesis BshC [Chitinophagaceae bacterium]
LMESTQAHLKKLNNTLDALELKFKRHLKKKETLQADQWQKIQSSFFPDGHLQERHENFLSWHQKWGDDLLKMLHQSCQPFGTKFCLIVDEQKGI